MARNWLQVYLPHCLQKINRVSFGLMNDEEYNRFIKLEPLMPESRSKLAIPFVGKLLGVEHDLAGALRALRVVAH